MENVIGILKKLGIDVPEDKVEALNKEVAANYKTIAEFDKRVNKAEEERDSFKNQLQTATDTLKGFDGVNVDELKKQITDWKTKAEAAENDFKAKIAEREFSDALTAELGNYKFSSEAAKNYVASIVKGKGLKVDGGKILGLTDVMNDIKAKDASAFAEEDDSQPAKFTRSMGGNSGGKTYKDRAEIMKIKDATERQAAIAANLDLFQK